MEKDGWIMEMYHKEGWTDHVKCENTVVNLNYESTVLNYENTVLK